MKTISVNIPFSGFYESKWSGLVDNDIEYQDDELPEQLRSDSWYRHINYSQAYDAIAREP